MTTSKEKIIALIGIEEYTRRREARDKFMQREIKQNESILSWVFLTPLIFMVIYVVVVEVYCAITNYNL